MEKRTLGRTGLEVSVLGLGGVFVSNVGAGRAEGERTIRRAVELGVTYIDTARSYADSEEVIGSALRDVPPEDRPHIATKIGGWPIPFNPKDPTGLQASVRESLKNLQTARVAGLQVHEPDRPALFDWWDDDETASGPVNDILAELKEQGMITFTGLAGTTAYELARRTATGKFDAVLTTFNYSLLWREAEHSVIDNAKTLGMGIIAGTPLQQGALAARYDTELATATWISPPRKRQYEALYKLLDELHLPIHEVAIRFIISNPDIATVVVGARSVAEIEANVEAAEKGPLPADVLAELDHIADLVPFRPFEEPGGAFGLPFRRPYKGPGPLQGTGVAGGITTKDPK
jgi:aryl-alcohol dehydrogenase-like predicted oxidoreductase